jgi:hypothetical protein
MIGNGNGGSVNHYFLKRTVMRGIRVKKRVIKAQRLGYVHFVYRAGGVYLPRQYRMPVKYLRPADRLK